MNLLRKHWFDIGGLLAIAVLVYVYFVYPQLSTVQTVLWLSLASLFIHQLEEYRYPGYFPGMLNSVLYKSNMPERYPLNPQTSFIVGELRILLAFLVLLTKRPYLWAIYPKTIPRPFYNRTA